MTLMCIHPLPGLVKVDVKFYSIVLRAPKLAWIEYTSDDEIQE